MRKVVLVMLILIFAASFAYAAECKACGNAKSSSGMEACQSRVTCGLCNVVFGWTEILYRPGKVVAEGGNPLVGFFRGVGYAITRTCVGAVEIVTFWTPGDPIVQLTDCPLCSVCKK